MAKTDYGSLSHEKSIKWNVALSQTCLRLSQETSLLHHQLSSIVDRNKENAETHERDEFAKSTFPLIKKHGHALFTKIIFPSNGEVMTTMPTALTGFGLMSMCALPTLFLMRLCSSCLGLATATLHPPSKYITIPTAMTLPSSGMTCG